MLDSVFAFASLALLILCMGAAVRSSVLLNRFPFLKTVRKHHVLCAVLCCICAFTHGILAGRAPAAISGKIAAMLLLLLIVLALPLRSSANRYWRRIHRTLSVIVIVLVAVDILHAVLT